MIYARRFLAVWLKRVTADGALGPFARSKRDEVLGRQDPPVLKIFLDNFPKKSII